VSTTIPTIKRAPNPPKNQNTCNSIDAAELIVHYLESIGVGSVFGVPGGAIEPLYNALAKSSRRENGLDIVGACHESGAAYMADGYQRESGNLGVCIATSGPGATNLITGVACAYDNNIPMLVITGQPAITSFGKGALQESACTGVNVIGMFRHCTRYNSLVSHVTQLETKLVNAILHAYRSPQGPVHLSIPVDILRTKIEFSGHTYNLNEQIAQQTVLCDSRSVALLQETLNTSAPPLFFIGKATEDAIEPILRLAELYDAKFITTADAKGLVNVRHSHYRGVFGLGGHTSAMLTLKHHSGTIIALGTGFDEFSSGGWSDSLMNNQLVHIDSCADNLMHSPMAKLHIRGNLRYICQQLVNNRLAESPVLPRKAYKYFEGSNPNIVVEDATKYHSSATPIKPQRLMKELSERFPTTTRFVADAGNSMMWAPHYLQPASHRQKNSSSINAPLQLHDRRSGHNNWLRLTLNFAPMGWAIGAAVGIAKASPHCPVVCITGDGSYLMSGQEITVAARENLPVIFVILNDSVYGMVMHGQRLAGAEKIGFSLPQIDFAQLANALGINSHIINSPEDFDAIETTTFTSMRGPTLLDVRIDKEEIPPMIMRLKSLGSIKESLAS